ncbi:MAG: hypothetical protein KJ065_12065 [Anaerolineae bacterium]|nr:hypothetical protein [Anaerolineae bacterium]
MSANVGEGIINQSGREQRRRIIRYVAAALAAVTAVIYVMIGLHLVSVLDGNADQTWALAPAAAYALGAVLLVIYDRRLLWILGAALQVFVIFTYFNLALQRTPAYEVWGIVLRVVQLLILIALIYLEVRLPLKQTDSSSSGAREPLQSHR